MCVAKLCVFRCDEKITVQRKFKTTCHGSSVDGANEGFCESGERPTCARRVFAAICASAAQVVGSVAEFFEVEACAKHRVSASENDDVHLGVGIGLLHQLRQKAQNFGVERIACPSPIKSQCGNAFRYLIGDYFSHGFTVVIGCSCDVTQRLWR